MLAYEIRCILLIHKCMMGCFNHSESSPLSCMYLSMQLCAIFMNNIIFQCLKYQKNRTLIAVLLVFEMLIFLVNTNGKYKKTVVLTSICVTHSIKEFNG